MDRGLIIAVFWLGSAERAPVKESWKKRAGRYAIDVDGSEETKRRKQESVDSCFVIYINASVISPLQCTRFRLLLAHSP